MSGPLVIQYWHSEEPPPQIVEMLATFPRHNPGLQQLLLSESTAEAFIAEHFSRRYVEAFRTCAQPAGQADYLRYCAGYALGGICIDADMRCLGELSSLFALSGRGTVFGQRDALPARLQQVARFPYRVGPYWHLVNSPFAFERPGDPLLGLAIEVATANIENRIADGATGIWLTTGPGVFTSLYLLQRLGSADVYLDYCAGTVMEPSAALLCEVVEDRSTLDRALGGVETAPFEEIGAWVEHVGIPRRSQETRHWSMPDGPIFKDHGTSPPSR